jgi:4-hydroxybutyryl-CoA dehydratase/vinylacetyl-CoA-Delta-isomerase
VDSLLANVTKLNVSRHIYEIARLAQDIAGGLLATIPSEQDLEDPTIGKYVEKYMRGVAGVPARDRIRIARLIEALSGGTALVESMHGAGSPQAMKVVIQRQLQLDHKMRLATDLAGITESKETGAAKARMKGDEMGSGE